jgi:hypothetical protein
VTSDEDDPGKNILEEPINEEDELPPSSDITGGVYDFQALIGEAATNGDDDKVSLLLETFGHAFTNQILCNHLAKIYGISPVDLLKLRVTATYVHGGIFKHDEEALSKKLDKLYKNSGIGPAMALKDAILNGDSKASSDALIGFFLETGILENLSMIDSVGPSPPQNILLSYLSVDSP